MTQKFSQSHFRIQTKSQRHSQWHSDGPHPRPCRLKKTLQPSSQCPTAAYQPHRAPDAARAWGSRECTWDARQPPYQVCFFSLSGSNLRLTTYARMPKQNRTGTRPWGLATSVQSRAWRTFWSRHACQMTYTVCEKPPAHDRSYYSSYPPAHDCTYPSFWHITSQLTSRQKNYFNSQVHEVVCTRVFTSRRTACIVTREGVHLSIEPCTPSCDAWPFPSLNASTLTPFLHTLQHCIAATDLFVFNELGDHLESSEWILFAENPGDELSGVIKTITTEGIVALHLWSRWNARNAHDVDRNARNVGLHPDGLHRGSNVFHQSIHPVGQTHETLHRRTLFLDKYARAVRVRSRAASLLSLHRHSYVSILFTSRFDSSKWTQISSWSSCRVIPFI